MGGNALASFGARRHSKEEFEQISQEVCSLLAKFNPVVIPYYSGKDSFGDLDIIVDSLKETDYEEIYSSLGSTTFIKNKEVVSVLYKELQVDIIPMSEENKNTALMYYSYNDLGNLMGKIFHKFGVKYGHRGLTLPVRDGDHKLGEILLSKDPRKIFDFGGFSYDSYLQGYSCLEDIFWFIIHSVYFNSSIFALENLNSINRIRDRKRHTYHSFLEFLKVETLEVKGEVFTVDEFYSNEKFGRVFFQDKSFYLPKVFHVFPHAKKEYEDLQQEIEQRKSIKEKFNGYMVSQVTGLTGSDLGKFMTYLRESWGGFGPELLEQTPDTIRARVFMEFKEWVDD